MIKSIYKTFPVIFTYPSYFYNYNNINSVQLRSLFLYYFIPLLLLIELVFITKQMNSIMFITDPEETIQNRN